MPVAAPEKRKRSIPALDEIGIVVESGRGEFASRNILDTPPPWTQEWLDRHGLRVHYAHGRAELQYRT